MLDHIQNHLVSIYALEPTLQVSEVLMDKSSLESWLGKSNEHLNHIREQIILQENVTKETVHLGLYLHPEIFATLNHHHPAQGLNPHNFSDFCSAVEGVSHFLFVDHRTQLHLPVSAIEIELQGEIDKFISIVLHLSSHDMQFTQNPENIAALFQQMFSAFLLRHDLTPDETERYKVASSNAAKICKFLSEEYLCAKPQWNDLFYFLRKFYRQGFCDKIAFSALV